MTSGWLPLKRRGWSWQQPALRAIGRDDAAVEVRTKEPGRGEEHRGGV
ncbi:hypothetical protein ACGFYY_04045 [Streptomyces sp. NPDC048331]